MSRERILAAGAPGTGKTYAWLTIARLLPNVTFHIIDPDDGVIRVWKENIDGAETFRGVDNINYYLTPVWYGALNKIEFGQAGGVANALTDIRKKIKPGDWVVVEMLSNIWSMAQSGFVKEIFQEGIGEYFLRIRKELSDGAKSLEALKGWTDWQVINKMHNDDFIIPICYQLPSPANPDINVFMTTSFSMSTAGEVAKEEAEQKSFYGETMVRIDGQKQNIFRAQSIFLFSKKRGAWKYSTFIKDRGRKFVDDEELADFGLQYLIGIAGFEL